MAKSIHCYLSELLDAYQRYTGKTCTEIALDFDVTLSNLYEYRNGRGNPTARTIDKIVNGVEANCRRALEETSWR